MTIHTYIIHFINGDNMILTASDLSGAKAQVKGIWERVARIERVHKSGSRAVCPF